MTIAIQLTQNKIAYIDSDDSEFANYAWQYDSYTGYAKRKFNVNGKRVTKYLHRCIFEKHWSVELAKDELVDHENNNRLDCTTNNLRLADYSQNNVNKVFTGNKSGYQGVKQVGMKFYASISWKNVRYNSEAFYKIEDACNWYKMMKSYYHGDFGKIAQ